MEFAPGAWVKNPNQPSWGSGRVIDRDESKIRILFSIGEKLLDTRYVTLEETATPDDPRLVTPQLLALPNVNMGELERACQSFQDQFRNRRSNTNDGKMGMDVLEDMKAYGRLTRASAGRLFSWCHTGASYAEGVDLAQQICRLVYGRVPTKAEVEAAGLWSLPVEARAGCGCVSVGRCGNI